MSASFIRPRIAVYKLIITDEIKRLVHIKFTIEIPCGCKEIDIEIKIIRIAAVVRVA